MYMLRNIWNESNSICDYCVYHRLSIFSDSWIGETTVIFQWLSYICFPLCITTKVQILLLAHVVVFIFHTVTPLCGIKIEEMS
jgi:hypothetical protein